MDTQAKNEKLHSLAWKLAPPQAKTDYVVEHKMILLFKNEEEETLGQGEIDFITVDLNAAYHNQLFPYEAFEGYASELAGPYQKVFSEDAYRNVLRVIKAELSEIKNVLQPKKSRK